MQPSVMTHPSTISDQEFHDTVAHLQNLIRINTTNPPGNELKGCRYLASVFEKEGLSYQILESAPGRGNFVARIKGDGSQKPLLLTSHLDVVPCEKDKWDVDPFGAEIKDGVLYGRGAVDMKNMTAMELAVFLKAHKEKLPLKRDLIFVALADEEDGCNLGSKWMVENHPKLVKAEYALNEVGAFSLKLNNRNVYPIGVAEKGLCWMKIKATGDPGHGAMPHQNQAVVRLSKVIQKLAKKNLPFHSGELTKAYIASLAGLQSFPKNLSLKGAACPVVSEFILKHLFPDKKFANDIRVILHNTATPTIVKAGQKSNVIPSEAEIVVDGRILPGQSVASFLREIKKRIGPGLAIEVMHSEEPNEAELSGPFFDVLKNALTRHDPDAVPVPYLIPGFTDAKYYAHLGIKTYGFTPLKLPPDLNFAKLFHGHNERVPLESLKFGVGVLWDVVCKACL